MHGLLERQLRQTRGDPAAIPEEWRDFVAAVDTAYREADEDHALREHAMNTMLEELTRRNRDLQQEKTEQAQLIRRLEDTRQQLVHSEKLASIGQLAAGIAHEINNPVGFVHSNISSLTRYFEKLLRVLEYCDTHQKELAGMGEIGRAWAVEVDALKAEVDFAYLRDDIPALLAESLEGVERVRRIVSDLRDFSRMGGEHAWEMADLRTGLDATLNIVMNEIKYRADVVKDYAEIPRIECLPAQLNQVFMNLMVNAAQAMPADRRGTITLRCGHDAETVWVEIADDGSGIAPEHLTRIFDPFFTTKPVGQGTGLGLALSFGIVEKHHGRIEVQSAVGRGTTFRIVLPRKPAASPQAAATPSTRTA